MADELIFQGTEDYIVSEDLQNSVNISVALKRPLLIKGEPGTGKTVLAESVARSLGLRLIVWNIKSTTKLRTDSMFMIPSSVYTIASLGNMTSLISSAILSWANSARLSFPQNGQFC
jgi:ABC-type uncharacterized transport system fused permease/ATPase subunit